MTRILESERERERAMTRIGDSGQRRLPASGPEPQETEGGRERDDPDRGKREREMTRIGVQGRRLLPAGGPEQQESESESESEK